MLLQQEIQIWSCQQAEGQHMCSTMQHRGYLKGCRRCFSDLVCEYSFPGAPDHLWQPDNSVYFGVRRVTSRTCIIRRRGYRELLFVNMSCN